MAAATLHVSFCVVLVTLSLPALTTFSLLIYLCIVFPRLHSKFHRGGEQTSCSRLNPKSLAQCLTRGSCSMCVC